MTQRMRADARRNRARVLDAAEAVFAAKGIGASTEEIAQRAGVGVGTVFRHYPTKEALLAAIVAGRLRRLAEEAGALADAEDPGAAFFAFFTRMIERSASKLAVADALSEAGVDVRDAVGAVGVELRRALDTLLSRAKRAGAVRDDVGVDEVIALLVGASRAAQHAGDPQVRARTLSIVLDGLRPRPGV